MSIASAKAEIRRRRHLTALGADPLLGPWRCLSTGGDYSHELHLDPAGVVTCSTCLARHGRRQCWATARVVQSLGRAKPQKDTAEPELRSWRSAFDEAQRRREEQRSVRLR